MSANWADIKVRRVTLIRWHQGRGFSWDKAKVTSKHKSLSKTSHHVTTSIMAGVVEDGWNGHIQTRARRFGAPASLLIPVALLGKMEELHVPAPTRRVPRLHASLRTKMFSGLECRPSKRQICDLQSTRLSLSVIKVFFFHAF